LSNDKNPFCEKDTMQRKIAEFQFSLSSLNRADPETYKLAAVKTDS